MLNMGPGMAGRVVPGIALPATHPASPPRVHLPPPHAHRRTRTCRAREYNSAVGLRSVDQLSLSAQISGFRGMTEVYNLIKAGIPNDHKYIPGTD